jgi:HIV-1 Vpr-binding protein
VALAATNAGTSAVTTFQQSIPGTPILGGGGLSSNQSTPLMGGQNQPQPFALQMKPLKSLTEIVTNYFRNEHAICRNPVKQCPPFSIFYPHRCPDPKLVYSAPSNIVRRHMLRSCPPYRCTSELLHQADRQMMYSRFRQLRSISDESETFTCCKFAVSIPNVLVGTSPKCLFF